jgi:hypothetical protein
LNNSYLTQTPDGSCVLFVDKDSIEFLKSFSYLSKIYPIVQEVYPEVTSVFIAENNLKEMFKSGKLEVYSIEVNQ